MNCDMRVHLVYPYVLRVFANNTCKMAKTLIK